MHARLNFRDQTWTAPNITLAALFQLLEAGQGNLRILWVRDDTRAEALIYLYELATEIRNQYEVETHHANGRTH